MWGTLAPTFYNDLITRFIPTHVGNTNPHRNPVISRPVHPHACGEHELFSAVGTSSCGSSPRMWGTLVGYLQNIKIKRFIPTHVGNTSGLTAPTRTTPVHPHACGEHIRLLFCFAGFFGSSPRMWGTHLMQLFDLPKEKGAEKFYQLNTNKKMGANAPALSSSEHYIKSCLRVKRKPASAHQTLLAPDDYYPLFGSQNQIPYLLPKP